MRPPFRSFAFLLATLLATMGFFRCEGPFGVGTFFFHFVSPEYKQLSLPGDVALDLRIPGNGLFFKGLPNTLEVSIDDQPIDPADLIVDGRHATGVLSALDEGHHELEATILVRVFFFFELPFLAASRFQLVDLQNPDECEILNDLECLLPFPSSRFLSPAATNTGYQVDLPANGTPLIVAGTALNILLRNFTQLDPTPFLENDGFSPTVQILMHFPQGVDVEGSNAPRIQPDTRTFDRRSLDDDSPTVLLHPASGQRIAHFIENDVRAEGTDRQATILRPLESLTPGERYVVAVRHLIDPIGDDVEAEPVFEALRDDLPSDIPAVNDRRDSMHQIFHELRDAGVKRRHLILAFDFVVASDENLTGQMLSMRDQSFDFLAANGGGLFTVDSVDVLNENCDDPDIPVWKLVQGTFQVPLFLETDPFLDPINPGMLMEDADGTPVYATTTHAPYGLAIPCTAFDGPVHPLLFGHGLFGTGQGTISGLSQGSGIGGFDYVAAGTNWAGLSGLDAPSDLPTEPPDDLGVLIPVVFSFIGQVVIDFDKFGAMPDRLRQGLTNTVVLGRMLKTGAFNSHPEFQVDGQGVIDTDELYYLGVSLGGVMGIATACYSPDMTRMNVDVPSINFSLLLQRATPFIPFDIFLDLLNDDALTQLLGIGLLHELWVKGESAACATHVTSDPLPGTNAKQILMTVAQYDQQVSNIGSEISGNTLKLPAIVGSNMNGLALMEDEAGPLDSAYVVYNTASFDLTNPDHLPFVPPLANGQAAPNQCDPHGRRTLIPASLDQLLTFLQPGGQIQNFCNGLCDAGDPSEIVGGESVACDPLD